TRMDRSEWPDLPMIAALRYRHDETGVRSAPAVGPITLEAYASVEDSDVDPNAEHRVHIIASYALYCKGLLPTEEQQLTIGTSGTYISNVRNVS
ncbi:MAG: hypothetical protein IKM54_06235, partial [Butyricicoccus sp.]|nr:hypothetical protein [Butyricicoccus sp.]